MKYIGNKSRLIGFIEESLLDAKINYKNTATIEWE